MNIFPISIYPINHLTRRIHTRIQELIIPRILLATLGLLLPLMPIPTPHRTPRNPMPSRHPIRAGNRTSEPIAPLVRGNGKSGHAFLPDGVRKMLLVASTAHLENAISADPATVVPVYFPTSSVISSHSIREVIPFRQTMQGEEEKNLRLLL